MKSKSNEANFSTISKKLIVKILAISSLITIFLTGLQLYREYNSSIKGLNRHLEQVAKIIVPEMTYNVWHLDDNAIRMQLNSMINLVDFDYVELQFDDEIIAFGKKITFQRSKIQTFDLISKFKGHEQNLGRLRIVTNLSPYVQNITDKAFIILLSNAIKTFILVFFMFSLFKKDILVHLNYISRKLSSVSVENLKSSISLSRPGKKFNDELDIVVNSINEFHQKIAIDIENSDRARIEKEELQEKLAQSQKMEALGRLAGGIAHDFNNILHVTIGSVEQAKFYLQKSELDKVKKYLTDIMDFSEKGDHLIKQILTYTHQKKVSYDRLNVTEVFEESLDMMRSTLPSNVSVEFNSEDDLYVYGDQTQMHQMVFNFCTNARDAIGSRPGFIKITISKNIETDKILISIEDSGVGVDQEVKEKVFEPYFSTKPVNEGTGMGLSIIHSIIEEMSGYIWLESKKDKGTTFYIVLPAITDAIAESNIAHDLFENNSSSEKNKQDILILDDEIEIATLHRDIINNQGAVAHTYTDPLQALADLKSNLRVDILLVDLSMPTLTGIEFAKSYKDQGGSSPVIILTGHEEVKLSDEEMLELNIIKVLLKPISRKKLLTALGLRSNTSS